MRGNTLAKVLKMLKAHVGDNLGANTSNDANYTELLNSAQHSFASQYDWDFLNNRWDVEIVPGQRYYSIPTNTSTTDEQTSIEADINFDKPVKVEIYYNTIWLPVKKGIGSEQYNFLNPALNQRLDPVQNWRIAQNTTDPSNPDTFEVWPVPTSPQTLRFTGQRLPFDMDSNDTSTLADMDDQLLALTVAVQILAGRPKMQALAATKATLANARLLACRAGMGSSDKECFLGGRPDSAQKLIKVAPLVVVAGGK